MSKDQGTGERKVDRGEQKIPAVRNFLYVVEKLEGGEVRPKILSENVEISSVVSRKMHRGKVVVDARLRPIEDQDDKEETDKEGESPPKKVAYKPFTYRIYDNRNNLLASGILSEPGKYRFWVERRKDDGGKETKDYAGRLDFESMPYIKEKKKQLNLVERNNPHSWQEIEPVLLPNGKMVIGIMFFDGSYIDMAGDVIEEYTKDGHLVRANNICMARMWNGRPLTGTWKLGKFTPKSLEKILSWMSAAYKKQESFPLINGLDTATVVRMGDASGEFEILAETPPVLQPPPPAPVQETEAKPVAAK